MLPVQAAAAEMPSALPRRSAREVLRRHPSAAVGAVVLAGFVLIAILAPFIEPYSTVSASGPVYAPPSAAHLLGTDDGGIDMVSLLMAGARISLLVGFSAAAISTFLGALVGLLSGYFGKLVDTLLMRFTDFLLVIPVVPVMIVIAAVWGASLFHLIAVIGALLWTTTARVVRAQVRSVSQRVYITRAVNIGSSHLRVLYKHILPQVAPLLLASSVVTAALAIFYETALAFLGLGDPTAVSWGTIIQQAFLQAAISSGAWWAIVPAGACVAVAVIAAYLVGQSIEERLDPRLSVSHLSLRPWTLRPLVGKGPDAS